MDETFGVIRLQLKISFWRQCTRKQKAIQLRRRSLAGPIRSAH